MQIVGPGRVNINQIIEGHKIKEYFLHFIKIEVLERKIVSKDRFF